MLLALFGPALTNHRPANSPLQADKGRQRSWRWPDLGVSFAPSRRRARCPLRLSVQLFYRLRPGATQALDRLAALRAGGPALRPSRWHRCRSRRRRFVARRCFRWHRAASALRRAGRTPRQSGSGSYVYSSRAPASVVVGGRTHRCRPTLGGRVLSFGRDVGVSVASGYRRALSLGRLSGPLFYRTPPLDLWQPNVSTVAT